MSATHPDYLVIDSDVVPFGAEVNELLEIFRESLPSTIPPEKKIRANRLIADIKLRRAHGDDFLLGMFLCEL